MSIKLKALGLGLLAVLATSAFAGINASATVGGHFVHHGPQNSAVITAHEAKGSLHQLKFYHLKANSHETDPDALPIECEKATYEGTASAKSVTEITLTPTYTNCNTEGGVAGSVTVTPNGCGYKFLSQGLNKHGTVEVECPAGKAIVIKHPNCEITVPAQKAPETLTEGVVYHNVVEPNGKSALTATVTLKTITGHYHGGICIFLGTSQKFEMIGSVTVKGYEDLGGANPEGLPISITHTTS